MQVASGTCRFDTLGSDFGDVAEKGFKVHSSRMPERDDEEQCHDCAQQNLDFNGNGNNLFIHEAEPVSGRVRL